MHNCIVGFGRFRIQHSDQLSLLISSFHGYRKKQSCCSEEKESSPAIWMKFQLNLLVEKYCEQLISSMRETQYLYFFIVYSYFIVKYFLTGRDRKEEKTWEREPLIITEHIPALIHRYLSWRCRYFFPILSTVLLFDLSESPHRPTSHFRHLNFRDRDLDVEVRKYAVVGPGAVLRRATIGSLVHKGSTFIS